MSDPDITHVVVHPEGGFTTYYADGSQVLELANTEIIGNTGIAEPQVDNPVSVLRDTAQVERATTYSQRGIVRDTNDTSENFRSVPPPDNSPSQRVSPASVRTPPYLDFRPRPSASIRQLRERSAQENENGVPELSRSGTSRLRGELRLRNPATRQAELRRRELSSLGRRLGRELGSLHAYLQDLINRQQHDARFRPQHDGPIATISVEDNPVRSDLQRAIDNGLVLEGNPPTIAGLARGLGSDSLVELFQILPGFSDSYQNSYTRQNHNITAGYLTAAVTSVIDIVIEIASLGVVALLRNFLVRRLRNAVRRVEVESIVNPGVQNFGNNMRPRQSRPSANAASRPAQRSLTPAELDEMLDLWEETIMHEPNRHAPGIDPEARQTFSLGIDESGGASITRSGTSARRPQTVLGRDLGASSNAGHSRELVNRYRQITGREPPPHGRDNGVPGSFYASHAEIQTLLAQIEQRGLLRMTATKDMCGSCRRAVREFAQRYGREVKVVDPSFIRSFHPNGAVEVVPVSGPPTRFRIDPSTEPTVAPNASPQAYEGVVF